MAPSNRRPGFSRRAQYTQFIGYVIAATGAVIGVVLLALSTFDPVAFRALRGGLAEVTTPVSTGLAAVTRGVTGIPAWAGNYLAVAQQNIALRQSLREQRALIMRARSLTYDNRRLRQLLDVRDGVNAAVVSARLVNSTGSSTRRFATLNAGSRDNVRAGQPVRGPDGLIGRTVAVTPNTARIMLLADPESIVPVRRTRDGLSAIAVGRGDGWVELKSAAASAVDFIRGDVFVTSGTGGLFPPGIPVARVIAKSSDTALGRTFAQPDTFDYALVMRIFVEQPPAPGPAP